MTPEELRKLEKQMKKAKRVASEWASQLHDLVEDRLPAAFEEIPGIAQSTFDACREWKEAADAFDAAQGAHAAVFREEQ